MAADFPHPSQVRNVQLLLVSLPHSKPYLESVYSESPDFAPDGCKFFPVWLAAFSERKPVWLSNLSIPLTVYELKDGPRKTKHAWRCIDVGATYKRRVPAEIYVYLYILDR